MTVKKLYDKLTERIPEELSEEWDNDGIMCSSDLSREVNNVLIALDVTEEIVDYAIGRNFDLIISHHPLIFKPLKGISEDNHVSRKIIKLISNNVSVFSFHTRADKVKGGVNDILAERIGLVDVTPFGEGCMGRIGTLPDENDLSAFADMLKEKSCRLVGKVLSVGRNYVATLYGNFYRCFSGGRNTDRYLIAKRNGVHNAFDIVIAVLPFPEDVEVKIDLAVGVFGYRFHTHSTIL
jgi:dinuclear metal center YbgI/SA1388 family protein